MKFPTTTLKVSSGLTYSYIYIPPPSPHLDIHTEYILFLHGFPSLPTDFAHQITYFQKTRKRYGILAPYLPGYGRTSHPASLAPYLLSHISTDITELLDHHGISSVHGVGHDWGATLLSRMEFYHPSRVSSMAFLTIGAAGFGQPFDLDAVNAMMKESLGYDGFGYMAFLTRDPEEEVVALLDQRQDAFRSLMFARDPGLWKENFGMVGGLKAWLEADRRAAGDMLESYLGDIEREHAELFAVDMGGYGGTLGWYRNHVDGGNSRDEAAELARRELSAYRVRSGKPVLQVLAGRDPIALAPVHRGMAEEYAPHVVVKEFDTGHWVMLEAQDKVSRELEMFFGAVTIM